MTRTDRLLRWYPPEWRERYGAGLTALIEDTLDGDRPPMAMRLSLLFSGLRERAHESGLVGAAGSHEERVRTGNRVVLWAWAAFVVAGLVLAKRSEHLGGSGPIAVLAGLAVSSLVLVTLAGVTALPSFVQRVRHDGWGSSARPLRRAAAMTVVGVAATVALVAWAHTLPAAERAQGTGSYGLAFLVWSAVVVATIVAWIGAASAAFRHALPTTRVLAFESILSTGVAVVMVAMTLAAAAWWGDLGSGAPGQIGLIVSAMVAADAIAGYGVDRLHRVA